MDTPTEFYEVEANASIDTSGNTKYYGKLDNEDAYYELYYKRRMGNGILSMRERAIWNILERNICPRQTRSLEWMWHRGE